MVTNGRPPNVFDARCTSARVLGLIANKWTALIIHKLAAGTKRYGELQHAIGGVSQKMLTQTLRNLQREGIVQRTSYPTVPPKVEYALTPLGRTLVEPLRALCRWAEEHSAEIETARRQTKAGQPAIV